MSFYDFNWINIDGNYIHKTAVICDNVIMGRGNWIGAYTVIGSNGEIRGKNPKGFKGLIVIGDNNVISEHVTIQRPFDKDMRTTIGSNNIIMAHAHIGHDATVGDDTEICTSTVIGGYAVIEDKAKIKLNCTIRNRIKVGEGSIVGMCSAVIKDVEPFTTVVGVPAKPLNKN